MALIKCKECGQEFSDKAEKCPSCGLKTFFSTFQFMSLDLFNAIAEEAWNLRQIRVACYQAEQKIALPYNEKIENNTAQISEYRSSLSEITHALAALKNKLFTAKKQALLKDEMADLEQKISVLEKENGSLLRERNQRIGEYRKTAPSEWSDYEKLNSIQTTNVVMTSLTREKHRYNYLRYYLNQELSQYLTVAKKANLNKLKEESQILAEFSEDALKREGYKITKTAEITEISFMEKPKVSAIDQEIERIRASIATSSVEFSYEPATKKASVVGRAIAGAAVAGPVGAIVGALSAVDKNNRK